MRSGSHVQLAALRNRDLELQTTSPFSNHETVERSTACFRHKNVLKFYVFQKFPFFCVTLYIGKVRYVHVVYGYWNKCTLIIVKKSPLVSLEFFIDIILNAVL